MADYLILKQTSGAWGVINQSSGKTANVDGESAAIVESFQGPGKYVALRIDNARVVNVTVEPKLTEVVAEEPEPEEPPVEDPPPEDPPAEEEPPAEEPGEDELPAEEPPAGDPPAEEPPAEEPPPE